MPWKPTKLFTTGVNGAWYDPSDINLTWRGNLLTYSEQFDNAAWVKRRANITPNAIAAPDGTITAYKVVADTSTNTHGVSQLTTTVAGTTYTQSFFAKAGEYRYVYISPAGPWGFQRFDLQTGTVGPLLANFLSASIDSVGNGWYRCSATWVSTAANNGNYIWIGNSTADAASFAGDGTSGIYIWGAQLEVGSTVTPYQRITDGIKDYLDYNPLPILYQDAAGTTPVTAVGQPVGLMLDKSKGLVLGPELVTQPIDVSGSSFGVVGSGVVRTTTSFTTGAAAGGLSIVGTANNLGKFYKISLTFTKSDSTTQLAFRGALTDALGATTASSGTINVIVPVTADYNYVYLRASAGGCTVTITSLSVRELPGNHAFNPSGNSANFPVLSARYNLLTNTDFSGAVAGTPGTAPTGWAFGVSGGTLGVSGKTLTFSATANRHWIFIQPAISANTNYVFSTKITQNTGNIRFEEILLLINAPAGTSISYFADGTPVNAVTFVPTSGSTLSAQVSVAGTAGSVIIRYGIGAASVPSTGTVGLTQPDLRVSNDALNQPAYQRVNTATDYDTVGFKPYLAFNGVNQWLQTNSIDFTYGDKMFVSAGVRKLSDASTNMIVELSTNVNINSGSFYVIGPVNTGGSNYAFVSNGTQQGDATGVGYVPPITNVFSAIGNISGDRATLRINGTQVAVGTGDQGTGNYGNYPLFLGARAGSSLWFNGRLYGLVIAGKQASAAEITSTETYLNNKTGAYA